MALNATRRAGAVRRTGSRPRHRARHLARVPRRAPPLRIPRRPRAACSVYDDYAHHPTEVAAELEAARAVVGEGRLIAVFQPGTYSRTQTFAREFADAMAIADIAVVMDIFPAREEPIPGVSGALIADQISLAARSGDLRAELLRDPEPGRRGGRAGRRDRHDGHRQRLPALPGDPRRDRGDRCTGDAPMTPSRRTGG